VDEDNNSNRNTATVLLNCVMLLFDEFIHYEAHRTHIEVTTPSLHPDVPRSCLERPLRRTDRTAS
jgi:hypothetical protein